MAVPMTWTQRVRRKVPRSLKYARQWIRAAATPTRAIFVVGSQRSGTRLPLQLFDQSPAVMTYSEGAEPYFDGVLLRPLPVVERLLERSPFPVVVLKPICETHRVIELLDRFPGSRAIWIFRHYRDAVNSASAKWKSGREAIRQLATGECDPTNWRAGGLTAAKLETVRRLYRDDLSLHAANAIMWYLRNDLFFELGAASRQDVLLVSYEDLVTEPGPSHHRLFTFANVARPESSAGEVYESSVAKRPFPEIPGAITALCQDVEARLRAHYRAALQPCENSVP
jgi:hypothetical protein